MKADILLFGIHGTVPWWRYLGQNLECGKSVVVTDLRGEGDLSVVNDFYAELNRMKRKPDPEFTLFTDIQIADIKVRCRALRWMDPDLAKAMIQAMAIVFDRILGKVQPSIVLSFPIDRYVKDVIERLSNTRGIQYLELTASVVPGMSMLLHRGRLMELNTQPSEELVKQVINQIATPSFLPSYVSQKTNYTKVKFIKTLGYFRARALAFRVISWMQRDPLNLHYIDAQPYLGHKCQWKDLRIVDLCDPRWQDKLLHFPKEKRIFFGLQLFPEASIDYWIKSVELIEYENLIVDAARAFSEAGFLVLVKDHPLQFGFRQTELIDRLLALPNVVLVPYDVEGNRLLELVDVNFTCTGTLGLQAALAGKTSIVTDSYYTNQDDFILFSKREEVKVLPERVLAERRSGISLQERKERIIGKLLRGSFAGDFFSFKDFDCRKPTPTALHLAQALGQRLVQLREKGE
jgi:hypothetical protein